MTSHRDSRTITDVKTELIPGVQTGNGIPHNKYNIRGIAHVRTNRKDDIFMQRLGQIFKCILEWGKGHVKNQDRARPKLTQPLLCLFTVQKELWKLTRNCHGKNANTLYKLTQDLKKMACFSIRRILKEYHLKGKN